MLQSVGGDAQVHVPDIQFQVLQLFAASNRPYGQNIQTVFSDYETGAIGNKRRRDLGRHAAIGRPEFREDTRK